MTHTIVIYDSFDCSLAAAFNRGMALIDAGHPIRKEVFSSGRLEIIIKMWITFSTEEEAALWKLTYL